MNCVNHPENPVAAYCQNCGKALCANCVRAVAGVIYCEQCLAERLGMGAPFAGPGAGSGAGSAAGAGYPVSGVIAPAGPNPGAAFGLGFIPGVGAMYNGQFVKGLVHVLVFVILIGITKNHGIFGIFIAAWVFYQVFDAFETAKARRDGRPLPDPFGLNDLGAKLGVPGSWSVPGSGYGSGQGAARGFTATQVPPVPPPPGAAGFTPAAGFADPYAAPYTTAPPVPPGVDPTLPPPRRNEPIGALVLIGLGVLFLLNTLNIFDFDWIGRMWPLLIIGAGVALFIRRSREIPPPPPPPTPGGMQ